MRAALGAILVGLAAAPPPAVEVKLEPELVQKLSASGVVLGAAPRASMRKLGLDVPAGARAFRGEIDLGVDPTVALAIVERGAGSVEIFADANLDGRPAADERLTVSPAEKVRGTGAASLSVPLAKGPYRTYPLRVIIPLDEDYRGPKNARYLYVQDEAVAVGHVDVDGRRVRLEYTFDPSTGEIDPTYNSIGVDSSGDERIVFDDNTSLEVAFADHEEVVFRVGDRFLSTERVDARAGGADGRILSASSDALRGPALDATLSRYIPAVKP